jgi:RNA polymerase sigma factor (sigma-70 family)
LEDGESSEGMAEEQVLAKALRDGEESDFNGIYERVAPALFSWARLRIPPSVRPFLDEQDVVQEVWIRAVAILDRFDPAKMSFRAWILKVAKYVLLEAIRKLRADPWVRMKGGPSTRFFVLHNCPDSVTRLSARMRRDERVEAFTSYVEAMPSPDREILMHCGLEDQKADEVATRLEMTPEAVLKRWQRLRKTLRENGILRGILMEE